MTDAANECERTNKLVTKLLKSSIEMKLGDKVRLTPKYAVSLMKSGKTRGIACRPQGGTFDWRTRTGEIPWISSRGNVGFKWLYRKTVDPCSAAAPELVKACEPPPNEWTPVVGSQSQEVSDGRTSTSVVQPGIQATGR